MSGTSERLHSIPRYVCTIMAFHATHEGIYTGEKNLGLLGYHNMLNFARSFLLGSCIVKTWVLHGHMKKVLVSIWLEQLSYTHMYTQCDNTIQKTLTVHAAQSPPPSPILYVVHDFPSSDSYSYPFILSLSTETLTNDTTTDSQL